MDVSVHLDEVVVDSQGPQRQEAVAAALRPALVGVLDAEAAAAVGRAVTEALSGAVPERPSSP